MQPLLWDCAAACCAPETRSPGEPLPRRCDPASTEVRLGQNGLPAGTKQAAIAAPMILETQRKAFGSNTAQPGRDGCFCFAWAWKAASGVRSRIPSRPGCSCQAGGHACANTHQAACDRMVLAVVAVDLGIQEPVHGGRDVDLRHRLLGAPATARLDGPVPERLDLQPARFSAACGVR